MYFHVASHTTKFCGFPSLSVAICRYLSLSVVTLRYLRRLILRFAVVYFALLDISALFRRRRVMQSTIYSPRYPVAAFNTHLADALVAFSSFIVCIFVTVVYFRSAALLLSAHIRYLCSDYCRIPGLYLGALFSLFIMRPLLSKIYVWVASSNILQTFFVVTGAFSNSTCCYCTIWDAAINFAGSITYYMN